MVPRAKAKAAPAAAPHTPAPPSVSSSKLDLKHCTTAEVGSTGSSFLSLVREGEEDEDEENSPVVAMGNGNPHNAFLDGPAAAPVAAVAPTAFSDVSKAAPGTISVLKERQPAAVTTAQPLAVKPVNSLAAARASRSPVSATTARPLTIKERLSNNAAGTRREREALDQKQKELEQRLQAYKRSKSAAGKPLSSGAAQTPVPTRKAPITSIAAMGMRTPAARVPKTARSS